MNEEYIKKHSYRKVIIFIVSFIIIILVLQSFVPKLHKDPMRPPRISVCLSNLKQLGFALHMYAQDNSKTYPTPDKWCDLIKPYIGRDAEVIMRCPAIKEGKCHYAMNPNCEPNSPPDTVLLFETKGGWNLSGGPELLTTENHSNKTANIYFKDGSYKRIRKEEIPKLKWNAEEKK
jgi:hypothetical protein